MYVTYIHTYIHENMCLSGYFNYLCALQVIYAFPAMAGAVMRSGGLKHPDLSGIAASYAPEICSMHLLTPILQEVIRRDDLCDWMEVFDTY